MEIAVAWDQESTTHTNTRLLVERLRADVAGGSR